MTTIRLIKRERYTSVNRALVNDERLSFKARGLLVWLLDKPDDWHSTSASIAAVGPDGRDAIRSALRELEEFGYVERHKIRNDLGQWETFCDVYECPISDAGKPGAGQADAGEPGAIEKTDLPKTELLKTDSLAQRSTNGEPDFAHFWSQYPRRKDKAPARRAWAAATKKAEPAMILAGLEPWLAHWRIEKTADVYIPYPATWLNRERWKPEEAPPASRTGGRQSVAAERVGFFAKLHELKAEASQ